ncbi:HNH endonuclease signature motif containing protein [Myxococcus sp. SDU36]|uniref:HNH endonuclease n=1 Tax=Myxococcus sp. SDU36 TaxID=2831967 RepID=UPI0025438AD7|nr:HNH endonuclease signature motif containing protein [Myxococcus sp. SDU36]WIG93709.1 HNH endonuclease [Myxococcus sp. SDU36]
MHTLYLVLLAVAVATPSTMEVPAAPSPFEPAPLLESVIPDGQAGIAGRDKDKDKDKKDRSGKAFTKRQKTIVKDRNAKENDGKIRCVNCDVETVPGKRHQKGVTPPTNEAHVDHKRARSKGGAGDVENGQVLCRKCNLKKGNRHSCDGKSK